MINKLNNYIQIKKTFRRKITNFIRSIFGPLTLKLLKKILKIYKYKLLINPASHPKNTRYIISRDLRKLPESDVIQYFNWHKHKIYFQKNDLRGSMISWKNSYLDFSIIYCLFYFNALFHEKFSDLVSYDLGANYGTYTISLTELNIPILLVEPNPFIAKCLRLTFKKNTVIDLALVPSSSTAEIISINLIPESSGSSSLLDIKKITNKLISSKLKDYIDAHSLMTFTMDVKTITPELLFSYHEDKKNAFIKLDVEGIEVELFRNGFIEELEKRFKNFILLTEYLGFRLSESEKNSIISSIGNYPCLILSSNTNKTQIHNFIGRTFLDIFKSGYKFSDFFNSNLTYNKVELEKALLNSKEEGDILVFSDIALAESLTGMFRE